jgi:hypothetical protein
MLDASLTAHNGTGSEFTGSSQDPHSHGGSDPAPLLDLAEATRHCQTIGMELAQTHLRAIHWDSANMKVGGALDLPPGDKRRRDLEDLQRRGYRLYLIAGGGKEDKHVQSLSHCWAEWDGLEQQEVLGLLAELGAAGLPDPTLVLNTWKRGSIHVWWQLEQACTDVQRWRQLMGQLVLCLGSDRNCVNPSRLMRLAGSAYWGKAGKPHAGEHRGQARILEAETTEATCTLEELEQFTTSWMAAHPDLGAFVAAAGATSADPPTEKERAEFHASRGHQLPPVRPLEHITALLDAIPKRESGLPDGNYWKYPRHRLIACGLRDALYRLYRQGCTDDPDRDAAEHAEKDAIELMEQRSPSKECSWRVGQVVRSSAWLDEGNFWKVARHLDGFNLPPMEMPLEPIPAEELASVSGNGQQPKPAAGGDPDAAARDAAAEHMAAAATTIDLGDVFHPWLAERLTARARSFPLHPLWLLAPALTATSAIVGTRAKVMVKRGWTEPLIFWTGNVVEASTLKTAAAGVFQGPLTRIEIDDRRAHRDAVKAQQEGDPDPPPPVRRLAMDATYEAIAAMAAAPQNHGIASFQDELSGWFANLRRDCSATARAGWLQLWSGQPILIDRKTSEPVFAARCAVSLFGNVQPSKLAQMMAATGDGAESAGDGLWARFLWVRPPHVPFRYVEDDADIAADIRALLERLNSTPAGTDDDDQPLLIQLNTEARAALAPWWEAWAQEQLCSPPGRAAFMGKLRGYSVRLAGLLALLDVACDAIPSRVQLTGMEQLHSHGNGWCMTAAADHVARAIRLCLFFLAQFDALQSEIGHGELPAEVAQLVARARDHGEPVSVRQVVKWKLPHRDATSAEATSWLRDVVVGTYAIGQMGTGQRRDQTIWRLS